MLRNLEETIFEPVPEELSLVPIDKNDEGEHCFGCSIQMYSIKFYKSIINIAVFVLNTIMYANKKDQYRNLQSQPNVQYLDARCLLLSKNLITVSL